MSQALGPCPSRTVERVSEDKDPVEELMLYLEKQATETGSTMEDLFMEIVEKAAAECGMTTDQFLQVIVMGDRRHPEAPDTVCGSISPYDPAETSWCLLEPNHPGDHGASWASRNGGT